MRTLLSLSLCLLLVGACSDPEDPPATDTGSDTSVVPDTGPAPCPDDYEAADGTACDQNGQSCTNCTDGCSMCWFLNCEDGTWVAMESFPPEDACTDAGPSDTGPDPTDTGPDPTDTGPDPTDTGPTDTGPTDTGPTDTGPTDTGTDPCPDDWEAANGTPCDVPGQSCNNCGDPCTPCWILICEGGTWMSMEAFPPPDACNDAGPAPSDEGTSTDAGVKEFTWFTSCGDPVCNEWTEKPEMSACSDEVEGGVCASEGVSCDPHPCAVDSENCDPESGCNSVLICAASDPKEDGCPISQRAAKRDIHYLDNMERQALYEKLTQIPLASWRYKNLGPTAPESIGFIIEDLKQSPAVQSTGERVNLYGYTTMAVAAFQVQAEQIKSLQSELKTLRTELKGIRKDCAE